MKAITFYFILILATVFGAQVIFADSGTLSKPNDKFFPRQWALFNDGTQKVYISIDDSHTISQLGVAGIDIGWLQAKDDMNLRAKASVIVAVIDTGIDFNHPDLAGRITSGGWDFLNQSPLTDDSTGHGTHVSGIIAANSNNREGIAGVAPSTVKILPLKVVSLCSKLSKQCYDDDYLYNGKLISDYVADAVRYAMAHHADIINLSLSWPGLVNTDNVRSAFREAIQAGIIIVASAGNFDRIHTPYPCAFDGVICVGAVTNTGAMSIYSNYGGLLDILAPGDDIVSTFPTNLQSQQLEENGYDLGSGGSEASPQVAGVAAAIESVYPGIKAAEVKARLFNSASQVTSDEDALFGIVNLKRALDPGPQSVFWPNFRSLGTIDINEKDLAIGGTLPIQYFYTNGQASPSAPKSINMNGQIWINGKPAGQITANLLPHGTALIPWTYHFASLDDPADLLFKVQLNWGAGLTKVFNFHALASRKAYTLTGNRTYFVKGTQSRDWIEKSFTDHFNSKLSTVENIYSPFSPPIYFRVKSVDEKNNSSAIDVFDTSQNENAASILVPGIQQVSEVIKGDFLRTGQPSWVITGIGTNAQGKYLEFCYLDSQGQLVGGSVARSVWQISLSQNPFLRNILTYYGGVGSWITRTDPLMGSRLTPAFFSKGTLPDKDNFNAFTVASYMVDNHLYYLAPLKGSSDTQPTQLEVRAVDSATFRSSFKEFHLINLIRPRQNSPVNGHIQILAELGSSQDSPIDIFDIPSSDKVSLIPTSWDPRSARGLMSPVLGETSLSTAYFLNDVNQGSVAWSSGDGSFGGRTEFAYASPMNPIGDLLGAFNLPTGNYFFIETGFDIVGYALPQGVNGPQILQKISIERDTGIPEIRFRKLLVPLTVGTEKSPVPGIYEDSTLVQGTQTSIAVWDTFKNQMLRPLRYSIDVPPGCVAMKPTYITSQVESLILPLICQGQSATDQASIVLVKPSN